MIPALVSRETNNHSFLSSIASRWFGAAGEVRVNHLAGPALRGDGAIQHRLCHVAEDEPAVVLVRHGVIIAKGCPGGDLSLHDDSPLSVTGNVTDDALQMFKRNLHSAQVLAEAKAWADELTAMEIQGASDLLPAWRRLEDRYGIPFGVFWSLQYRRGQKDIWASVHLMLRLAVEAERARQLRQLSIKQDIDAITGGNDEAAADARRTRAESDVRRV